MSEEDSHQKVFNPNNKHLPIIIMKGPKYEVTELQILIPESLGDNNKFLLTSSDVTFILLSSDRD